MNDTDVYIFGENQTEYIPFKTIEDNQKLNYNDNNNRNNNFCPICHYNLNSAKHKKLCGNSIPI